jgi:hypothetical protein
LCFIEYKFDTGSKCRFCLNLDFSGLFHLKEEEG